jgi:ABC-type multidrug transport system permease subunit
MRVCVCLWLKVFVSVQLCQNLLFISTRTFTSIVIYFILLLWFIIMAIIMPVQVRSELKRRITEQLEWT